MVSGGKQKEKEGKEERERVMVSEEGIVGLLGAKVRLSVMKNLESK